MALPAGVRRRAGFTLLEVLVALAIAAVALVVVPASMVKLHQTMQYRGAVGDVLAGLKAARLEATKTGQSVPFAIDVESARIGIGGSKTIQLPSELQLRFVVAQREIWGSTGRIRFYPDGSSTGGSIELRRPNGYGVRLRVDWLFGRVTQEALD